MSQTTSRIVIIGAGIVGIATAALAFSEIMPPASPKILLKAPKWLLDLLQSLSVRPSNQPQWAGWSPVLSAA